MTNLNLQAGDQPLPKITKLSDYAKEGIHLAAAAGVVAAVGFWVGPLTLGLCALGTGALTVGGLKLSETFLPKIFLRREIKPEHGYLEKALNDFTVKIGLKEKPILYDFEINKKELEKEDSISSVPAQLQRVFNAGAAGIAKPVVIVSQPLLDVLQPEETRAVIAHEFAHLGAGHTKLQVLSGWLQATAMLAATFGLGGAVVSTGWLVGILSIAGTFGVAYVGNKLMPKKEERYTREGTLKPEARRKQIAIWGVQEAISVGLLAAANPIPVLTAVAIEHGFFWSANMVNKSLSRRNEFQADRGAVAMGADPLALITSLRKLEAIRELYDPELANALEWRKGPLPMRLVKMVESLLKSHPDTQRRCRRLAKMAKREGYSAEAIAQAMTGPVDISTAVAAKLEDERKAMELAESQKAKDEGIESALSDFRESADRLRHTLAKLDSAEARQSSLPEKGTLADTFQDPKTPARPQSAQPEATAKKGPEPTL